MKKKKVEQVNLFQIDEPVKESKPIQVKEEMKQVERVITINHYFQESEKEGICRLCGNHGRHAIHGRKRK